MKLLDKLKSVKKRWYLLLAVVLVLAVAGGVAANVYFERKQEGIKGDKTKSLASRQVLDDLLYLEKFATLKVTPDQAKEILPLVDQLNSSDTAVLLEASKQIYGKLSPLQYQALEGLQQFDKQGKRGGREKGRGFKGQDFRRDGQDFRGDDGLKQSDPREAALTDVVINMLKARSTEKPVAQSSTNSPNPNPVTQNP